MSSSYLANVPKLKGRENFDDWAFAVENLLVLEGAEKYLKQEGTGAVAEAADAKTRAKMILTIDSSLFVHIKDTTTAKELWTKLHSLFDDSGFSRRITLLRHLISIRLESCENMTNYVTQIVETSQRLSGTGFAINDEWVGSLLLAGLPERFMPMIMAIEHSGIQITADSIKSKLLDMEVEDLSETERSSALAAKWQKKPVKQNSTSKHGGQTTSTSKSGNVNNTKTIICYRCREIGHYRNQCPLLEEKTETKKQNNAFNVVFLSGGFSKSDFYIDSGASMHMTPNECWLKSPQYSSSLPEIIVANKTKIPVLCSGDIEITTSCNYDITVKNALCVPSLTTNLLSVSELIKNGNSVVFKPNKCLVKNRLNKLVAVADLVDGVYKVRLQAQKCLLTTVGGVTWHRRFGNIKSTDMNKMKSYGLVEAVTVPVETTDSVGELLEESAVNPEHSFVQSSSSGCKDKPECEEPKKRQRKKPERTLSVHCTAMHPQSSSVKRYVCVHCFLPCDSRKSLTEHMKVHGLTAEKKFLCDLCGKVLANGDQLRLHKRGHYGVKPYTCGTCNKSFAKKFNLQVHQNSHSSDKAHECGSCGRQFSQRSALKRHCARYHHLEPDTSSSGTSSDTALPAE